MKLEDNSAPTSAPRSCSRRRQRCKASPRDGSPTCSTPSTGIPRRVDAVFGLLDDINPSFFFEDAQKGLKFCDGASTATLPAMSECSSATSTKLDREGRDYWLKPLWEIGALEKLYFDPDTGDFMPGHPVPKSPNSAYRIAPAFLQILKAPDADRKVLLAAWASEEAIHARLPSPGGARDTTRAKVGTPRMELITRGPGLRA